ncbi:radical SAM family heme chaperone HemW [Sphingobium sufflavum]|uniref:radical SAM family heme chaperone HemW n=1 Tax=Sphingobium sufflavum TaxID=1129547 RepID=UPI001F234EF1|nr:radical SAM family heme chaperone HemW [Sphingobium sufflavum]MCE7795939.1 radical SAM family heme chaperone HemW [Sphingobium sufflavum]
MSASASPYALYVHWPFCVSKCPYCDFNSHVRDHVDQAAWRDALLADMAHEAARTGGGPLSSIFFGGGTPSLMPPATIAAVIEGAARHWDFAPDIEITMEANPNSAEAARFADVAAAGVNRVSLGVQSLHDEALKFLGRAHGADEGLRAVELAQALFGRVSFDLIYALPGQSEADWDADLTRALAMGTGHLSLYQLTIEPGTRFETMVRKGDFIPADPDHGATLYELTRDRTVAAGIPAYEVSNHARPGEESRHNLIYWRYGDYLGIGPGAHGRVNAHATRRHRKPENWMAALAAQGHGLEEESALAPDERMTEALMMGLRLAEGVDLSDLQARLGTAAPINRRAAERLAAQGLLRLDGARLAVTGEGMLLLDGILAELL